MGDWSDDEKPTTSAKSFEFGSNPNKDSGSNKVDDDWGDNKQNDGKSSFSRGRGRGGYNRNFNNDNENEGSDNRGFSGRGRGGYKRNFNNENVDEGSENRGRGGFNRDFNNENGDDENRGGFSGRGRGRGRGGFNRENRDFNSGDNNDFSERPPRRNRDLNEAGETGEEKKHEIYIPSEITDTEELFSTCISAGINFDNFDKIAVQVTGNGASDFAQYNTFDEAGFRDFILNNIKKSGYKKPTPIQKRAMSIIQSKRDLMGCAQTGSGKTAAFVLPILNCIMNDKDDMNPGKPQCLIMAPTRELAIQIRDEAMKFASGSYVKVCLVYGGAASRYQNENVTQGCHILVATPGRLTDFLNKGVITFEDLKFLVLDEADRMLDMGFRDTIDQVMNHHTLDKEKVTMLMFSATFPDEIQRLAGKYLRNYLFLTIGIVGGASADVEQEFIEVTRREKKKTLMDILNQYCANKEEDRILVFCETKKTADFLASYLSETMLSSTSIHGDRLQREREEALRDFRSGKRKVLVATAVAARGLDIKGVTHVINYDIPKEIDEYIHRIGRTGRVGNRGKATSFFDPENDTAIVSDLVRILTQANQTIPSFFGSSGNVKFEGADEFGASDYRQPVAPAAPQEEEEDW